MTSSKDRKSRQGREARSLSLTAFSVFAVEQPRGRKRINRLRPQSMMMCYAIGSD